MPYVILKILLWTSIGLVSAEALCILLLWVSSMFVDPGKEYDRNSRYYRFLLHISTRIALWAIKVKIHVNGIDNVPEGRFLLVGNHRSKFEPIIEWNILEKNDLAFISKPENFKVFAFGRIIRRCCFLPINRQDPRSSFKTFQKAAEFMKNDQVSMGVYPEGTRSKTGELLPFHDGVFKIAQMANVPILVVASRGTEAIRKNWFYKRTNVYFDFVELIPADYVKSHNSHEISARVRQDILNGLEDNE